MNKNKNKSSIVITDSEKWSRRQLLSKLGKGSAALALMPFVPIMEAGAQSSRAVRYIQWFNANASSSNNGFWQSNDGAINFPDGSPYAPFAKHRDDIALVANMNLQAAADTGRNPHNDATFACMTGDDRQFGSRDEDYSTLDQAIANDLRRQGINTLYKNLVFGFKNPILTDHTISIDRGNRANADRDPATVFDRLFGAVSMQNTTDPSVVRKQSVLDYVNESLKRLKPIVSQQDSEKLDYHLTSIREIEQRLDRISEGESCQAFMSDERLSVDPNDEHGEEVLDAYIDLMVAAFHCDITRVISFQMSFGHDFHNYGWLGYSGDFHAWTHGVVRQEFDADKREALPGAINRVKRSMEWRHEKIVRLMDKLKAINEPDGTLLDNTGILAWTETSRAHDYNNATWVLGGRMGGKINTGMRRNYGGAHHNQLLTTIAQAMGMQTNRFGASKYQSGVLPGLLRE